MASDSLSVMREAQRLSRLSTDQPWNPFRHISWDDEGGKRRMAASPASALEEGVVSPRQMGSPSVRLQHDGFRRRESSGSDTLTESGDEFDNKGRVCARAECASTNGRLASGVSLDVSSQRDRLSSSETTIWQPTLVGTTSSSQQTENETETAASAAAAADEKHQRRRHRNCAIFREVRPPTTYTLANQLQRTLLNSWANTLLLFAPAGIALHYHPHTPRLAVFVVNLVAIVPLAALISFATEELSLHLRSSALSGLLSALLGNAVELIVAVAALADGRVAIVQTSLAGSILSNLLLVLGLCFFCGGLRRPEQHFNRVAAQTATSLLALAIASVIVPTVFDYAGRTPKRDVASLSRGTAVILLLVYAAYLTFQLKTHQAAFKEEGQKVPARPWVRESAEQENGYGIPLVMMLTRSSRGKEESVGNDGGCSDDVPRRRRHLHRRELSLPPQVCHEQAAHDQDAGQEPTLHLAVALLTFVLPVATVSLCAKFMISSVDAATASGPLSEEFVGLILLPIVGNAAEHAAAVAVAVKDQMDLAIGVAVGSSMQVALFLMPLLVVIGWGLGDDAMNLSFDVFQVAVMFVAVLLVNYLIGDGKSHWLEGFLLICLYAIIAVCSFWYPGPEENDFLSVRPSR